MDIISRCGYIAIIGKPNVGKSTLINALVDMKLSAVSRKMQTTRHRINAVLSLNNTQFIFVDTPGFQNKHHSLLNKIMNKTVFNVLSDVDVILHVVNACQWTQDDEKISNFIFQNNDIQKILVINKIDKLKNINILLPYIKNINPKYNYNSIIPISANKKYQLNTLLDNVSQLLPLRNFIFDESFITDKSERFLTSEIIKEKIFRLVGDELPYKCTVFIEKWQEVKNGIINIFACIIVERNSHKIILLGSKGQHIKKIASEARKDIEILLNKKIYLEVYIKVCKGWLDNKKLLHEFGYE
ncbi:GTPase Era [Candidatus Kinetoplastibacterium sorsogonicusi]|uniref:GTPase Era n=1 Tax=Candidatus Kinetoplastidibacterium kentomonadis TaxID=1576550 RepID=A0A3Q8EYA0_9PROT|nr:GTPase Era [Candidatus Kinetoplastibacterium sorsogonicusi]AWD32551.1 GTPase Era [Candidatus Kinetoplastibacterium sorsogonicusi]